MSKVKVTIEQVPIKQFTKEEITFYFDNELARSLCCKIYSHTANPEKCKECGMTEEEHENNEWIGKPGHCSGFVQKPNSEGSP